MRRTRAGCELAESLPAAVVGLGLVLSGLRLVRGLMGRLEGDAGVRIGAYADLCWGGCGEGEDCLVGSHCESRTSGERDGLDEVSTSRLVLKLVFLDQLACFDLESS